MDLSSHALQLIISSHLFIQLYLHFINEVGTTVVLPTLNVSVEAVAIL